MEVGLVSCTKSKCEEAAQPKDLHLESAFFRKARQYIEANYDMWYILSAKHHLLDPGGEPIDPYDETLSGASVDKKRSGQKRCLSSYAKKTYSMMEIGSFSMLGEIIMGTHTVAFRDRC